MSATNTDATPGSAASPTPDSAEPEVAEFYPFVLCPLCDKSRFRKYHTAWALQKHFRKVHRDDEEANLSLDDLGAKYALPVSIKVDGRRRSSLRHTSCGNH